MVVMYLKRSGTKCYLMEWKDIGVINYLLHSTKSLNMKRHPCYNLFKALETTDLTMKRCHSCCEVDLSKTFSG